MYDKTQKLVCFLMTAGTIGSILFLFRRLEMLMAEIFYLRTALGILTKEWNAKESDRIE